MTKLYFRYGCVGSSKTFELLRVAYSYEQQKKRIVCIKPKIDTRFGEKTIQTRIGLKREANIITDDNSDIYKEVLSFMNEKIDCILVDEINFMSKKNIIDLRNITVKLNIPVICYGLKTDYLGNLFEGSSTLLSIADSIEEIKITCHYCNSKAILNAKLLDGKHTKEIGNQIDLGCEEKYIPVCYKHF